MPASLYVKPAPNPEGEGVLDVTDPVYINTPGMKHLPPEGRLVERTLYWTKLINAREVISCDPETLEPLEPPPPPDPVDGVTYA